MEYVKQEAKLVYLLECLQKTAPPVLVFAEKTKDVDDIHEYLLVKGVEAVAVHGGKDQEDRNLAIDGFKAGRKDVLVATDVASKGLDFPDIQHVINFDMPEEIENYVHRYVSLHRHEAAFVLQSVRNSRSSVCLSCVWVHKQSVSALNATGVCFQHADAHNLVHTGLGAQGGVGRQALLLHSSTKIKVNRYC